jgi:hypothetical protein
MSITKYQTTANILLSALASFLNPAGTATSAPEEEGDSTITPSPAGGKTERCVEVSLQHLDITIVSDYIEELELFFIYMKVPSAPLPSCHIDAKMKTGWSSHVS